MIKRAIIGIAIFGAAMLIGGFVGYNKGRNAVLIDDFQTYNADLVSYSAFPEARKVGLNDFLKARYYYFANQIPESSLVEPYDFGSVDFRGLTIGKGPTSPQHEYELFKDKKVSFKKPYVADGDSNSVPAVR
jgi:hypothetical protein